MNIDAIGKALITILGAILTYIVGPYILSKTTKEQREEYYFGTKLAVSAAEQIYKEKGQGQLKKKYVKICNNIPQVKGNKYNYTEIRCTYRGSSIGIEYSERETRPGIMPWSFLCQK